MPGLRGPLVDEEGFPRADIDVHAVRQARHRLACLQTDYREAQRRLEQLLLRVHAETAEFQIAEQELVPARRPEASGASARQEEAPPSLHGGERGLPSLSRGLYCPYLMQAGCCSISTLAVFCICKLSCASSHMVMRSLVRLLFWFFQTRGPHLLWWMLSSPIAPAVPQGLPAGTESCASGLCVCRQLEPPQLPMRALMSKPQEEEVCSVAR